MQRLLRLWRMQWLVNSLINNYLFISFLGSFSNFQHNVIRTANRIWPRQVAKPRLDWDSYIHLWSCHMNRTASQLFLTAMLFLDNTSHIFDVSSLNTSKTFLFILKTKHSKPYCIKNWLIPCFMRVDHTLFQFFWAKNQKGLTLPFHEINRDTAEIWTF